MSTALVIHGASGRMGQALQRVLPEFGGLTLKAALDRPDTEALDAALRGVGVLVDFSVPDAALAAAQACRRAGVPAVIGTTGLSDTQQAELAAIGAHIPLLVAPNMSIGVNIALYLVEMAAKSLGTDFDVEIAETHHRLKRDAPSGTALALGRKVAQTRGQPLEALRYDAGAGPRPAGGIGFAVSRGGDVAGEHDVTFLGDGERLVIRHEATDRRIFARGALRAVQWLVRQAPGVYGMEHVLDLR